jgi:hypothetical protein
MRFPHSFKRYVGKGPGDGKELGSDKPPEGRLVPTPDNCFESRTANVNGWPVQRVAIGFTSPRNARVELSVSVYVYDDTSEQWFRSGPPQEVSNGTLSYFDVPLLLDNARTGGGDGLKSQGALECFVVADKPSKGAEGEYIFIVGADISSPGT